MRFFVSVKMLLRSRCTVIAWLLAGCALSGCGQSPAARPPSPANEKATIRVLVVDDDALASALKDQWQSRASDDELEVRTATTDQLAAAKRLSTDVVIF